MGAFCAHKNEKIDTLIANYMGITPYLAFLLRLGYATHSDENTDIIADIYNKDEVTIGNNIVKTNTLESKLLLISNLLQTYLNSSDYMSAAISLQNTNLVATFENLFESIKGGTNRLDCIDTVALIFLDFATRLQSKYGGSIQDICNDKKHGTSSILYKIKRTLTALAQGEITDFNVGDTKMALTMENELLIKALARNFEAVACFALVKIHNTEGLRFSKELNVVEEDDLVTANTNLLDQLYNYEESARESWQLLMECISPLSTVGKHVRAALSGLVLYEMIIDDDKVNFEPVTNPFGLYRHANISQVHQGLMRVLRGMTSSKDMINKLKNYVAKCKANKNANTNVDRVLGRTIEDILDRLGEGPKSTAVDATLDNKAHLDYVNVLSMLKSAFYSDLKRNKTEYSNFILDRMKNGLITYKRATINRSNMRTDQFENFLSMVKLGCVYNSKNATSIHNGNKKTALANVKKAITNIEEFIANKDSVTARTKQLLKILEDLGIDCNNNLAYRLVNNKNFIKNLENFKDFGLKLIVKVEKDNKGHFKSSKDFFENREKDSLTDNNKLKDKRYNKVADLFKEVLYHFITESEGSILDAGLYRLNGKFVRMYTDVTPSYMADRIEEIKDAVENNSIQQLRDIIKKRYLRNAIYVDMDKNGAIKDVNGEIWNENSTVPPAIKNQWLRLLWNSAEIIKVTLEDGTKTTKEGKGIAEDSFAKKLNWNRILGNVKGKDGIDLDATDFADFDIGKHAVAMLRNFLHYSEINAAKGPKATAFADYPVFILGDANVFKSIVGPRVSTSRQDDWVDILYEVYELERARLNLFEKTNEKLKLDGYEKVENTYKKTKDEEGNTTEENATEYVYLRFINEYNKTHSVKFENLSKADKKKEIKNAIEEEVETFKQRMRAIGVYEIQERDNKKYSLFKNYNSEEAIDRLVRDFYINNKIATIQQFQIMTVDIGYYKNSKDLQKRYKEIHAPGNEMDVYAQWDEKYILGEDEKGNPIVSRKGVYFKDIEGNAEEYDPAFMDVVALLEGLRIVKPNKRLSDMTKDEIESIKEKGRKSKIYEDYKKCTYTDGQSFITLHTMRKIMVMLGKWNTDLENKYNQIVSLSKAINNAQTDEEKSKIKSKIIGLSVVFQPIKPYGFTHEEYKINDGVTALIPTQYKCAEAVIIPALLPEGSKLRALGEYMENPKNNLDYACSTQCIKVGNFGAVDITNTKAADLATALSRAYVHNTSWEDYRIQTNVPHHMSGERSMGTLIRKVILSQIKKNKLYTNYFKDLGIEGEGIMLDTKNGPQRKAATGSNIIDLYNSLISCNIYESLQDFKELIEDPVAFANILQHNVLNNGRDSLSKLLNYVLNDDQTAFDTELWEGGNAFEAQNLLLSVFRKLVNKQMFEGASLVQVSAWGTKQEDIITDENLTSICQNGNLLYYLCVIPFMFSYTNRFGQKVDLKFEDYCNSDGSFIMSEYTTGDIEFASWKNPNWKEGDPEDLKYLVPKIEAEFPGMLDLIAYRIPTERNYSCLNLKVVRCCTPTEGGIIKVPLETTTVAGFDFDIDKLYMLRKAFVEREDATTVQDVWDKVYEMLAVELGYSKTEDLTSKLEKALGTKPTKDNPLHRVWDKVPELKDYDKNIWFGRAAAELGHKEFAWVKKDFRWCKYDFNKTASQQTSDHSKVDNIATIKRNNALFHLMRCRLMDPETIQSRITPGGFKNPKIAGKINRELMYNSASVVYGYDKLEDLVEDEDWKDPEPNWDPTDAYTMLYYNQLNLIASKLIGIFANANTFKQYASVAYSIKLRTPIAMMDLSFDDLLYNHEGRDADLTLAEFLAASVDAVKDPVLNYLNLNEHTANVACLLGAIGYNPTEIGVFLNQPIIREAVRESQKNGTALSKSIRKILTAESGEGGAFEKLSFDTFSELEKQENLSFDTLCDNIRGILDEKANKNWRTDATERKSQYVVAHQLLDCLAAANDFTMLVQSTKFTASNSVTSTFGGMYEQLMKLNQFYQGEIQLSDGTIQKNGLSNIEIITRELQEGEVDPVFAPILRDGNMYDSTLKDYIKTVMRTPFGFELAMYDANKALLQIIKKYFPYETEIYRNTRKIAANTKVNGVVSGDTIDLLHEYMMISMLKNLPNSPFNPNAIITADGTERRSKEYFTLIFPRLFANFITSTLLGKDYPFLKRFTFRGYTEGENTYYTINVDSNSLAENFMDDDVIQGWDSMMRDPNVNVQRMAIDLFFYNFHTGGFRYGYNMFMNLCPNSVKKAIIATIERMPLREGEKPKENLIGYLDVLREIREEKRSDLGFIPTQLIWNFILENPNNRDFVTTLYGSEKDKDGAKFMFRNAIRVAVAEAKQNNSPITITLDGSLDSASAKLYNALKQGKKMLPVVVNGVEEKQLTDIFPVAILISGLDGNELYIANYNEEYVENYNVPANAATNKTITYTKVDIIKTRVFDNSDNAAAAMGLGSLGDYYYEDATRDPSYKSIKTILGKFIDWYVDKYGSDQAFESSTLKQLYDELEFKAFNEHQLLGDINFVDSKKLFEKLKGDPTANYREFIRIVAQNLIDTYYKEDVKNLNDAEKKDLVEQIQQASFWNRRLSWNSIDANISFLIGIYDQGYDVPDMQSDYTLNESKAPGGRGEVDFMSDEEKQQAEDALNSAEGLAGNLTARVDPAGQLNCKSGRRR